MSRYCSCWSVCSLVRSFVHHEYWLYYNKFNVRTCVASNESSFCAGLQTKILSWIHLYIACCAIIDDAYVAAHILLFFILSDLQTISRMAEAGKAGWQERDHNIHTEHKEAELCREHTRNIQNNIPQSLMDYCLVVQFCNKHCKAHALYNCNAVCSHVAALRSRSAQNWTEAIKIDATVDRRKVLARIRASKHRFFRKSPQMNIVNSPCTCHKYAFYLPIGCSS